MMKLEYERTCKHCGQDFIAGRKDKVFCSRNCKNLARIKRKKEQEEMQTIQNQPLQGPPIQDMGGGAVPMFYYQEKLSLIQKQEQEIRELKDKLDNERQRNHEHEKNEIVLKHQIPEDKPEGLGGIGKLIENPEAMNAIAGFFNTVMAGKQSANNGEALSGSGLDLENQKRATDYGTFLQSLSSDQRGVVHSMLNDAAHIYLNDDQNVFRRLMEYLKQNFNHARQAAN